MSVRRIFQLFAIGLAAISVHHARAATIDVPGHWDTISSAIAAADPGDTIRILNGAVYQESLTIDKPLTIVAEGATPTIKTGVDDQNNPIAHVISSGDVQFGSIEGGLITLDGGVDIFSVTHTSGEVVIENVHFTNWGDRAIVSTHSDATLTVRYAQFTSTGPTYYRHLLGDNATVNFYRVFATGSDSHAIAFWSAAGVKNMTFNMEFCEIRAGLNAVLLMLVTHGQFSVSNSFLYKSDGGTWVHTRHQGAPLPDSVIDFRNSVLVTRLHGNIMLVHNTGDAANLPMTVNFDHCDVVAETGGAYILRVLDGNRTVSITNTNIYSLAANSNGIEVGASGTIYENWNNIFVTGTPRNANVTPGPDSIDPAQDPQYADIYEGNALYSNEFLQTAGENGTPIGSFLDLSDAQNYVPVNPTGHWFIYK